LKGEEMISDYQKKSDYELQKKVTMVIMTRSAGLLVGQSGAVASS